MYGLIFNSKHNLYMPDNYTACDSVTWQMILHHSATAVGRVCDWRATVLVSRTLAMPEKGELCVIR